MLEMVHSALQSTLRCLDTIFGIPRPSKSILKTLDEIKETATAARNLYGQHKTYILDDGKSDEVMTLARKLKIGYIRRPTNEDAKAGNINYALAQTSGDFFVILDADFVANPFLLYETIPFFEDEKMSFVQTPQHYHNEDSFVSIAAGYMQHVFYSLVQAGKNRFNAAFCVGTNVVFRRRAIDSIGGMYSQSKSEDIWTSLMLHEAGYRSIYLNKVMAVGKTPETLKAYSKQQLRWATGSFEIFLKQIAVQWLGAVLSCFRVSCFHFVSCFFLMFYYIL